MRKHQVTVLFCLATTLAHAKVVLPNFFTDNMVVQQNSTLTIPGKAKPGKKVTVKVEWNKAKYVTKAAADGSFRIAVPTPSAGGPYAITLSDGEETKLSNVLSGEVWFCAGQSNMEMPLAGWGKVKDYEQEIANANYPSIRLLQVKRTPAFAPQEDVEINNGGWQECSPTSVPEFSSVAYFYARKLWQELNVPIGVINSSWGGTPAEAWTDIESLKYVMGYQQKTQRMKEYGLTQEKQIELYRAEMSEWLERFGKKDAGIKDGKPCWINSLQTGDEWRQTELPQYWEKHGLKDFDGTVWYQREVDIPSAWAGKEISLSLGVIDDDDITYVNGMEVGHTSGCNTPRKYQIPASLSKTGKALITVRAIDYGGGGGFHGDAQQMYMERDGQKVALSGQWNYHVGGSLAGVLERPVSPEGSGWNISGYPTVLYNGMVHPFTIFPIKGAIWYQGENNVGRDEQYRVLFQSMIMGWRKAWHQDFPFYFVQLANHMKPEEVQSDSKWAALRDAQAHSLHLQNTNMACIIDIGEAYDIHPKNKQEVGRRLALASLADTYGKGTYATARFVDYRIQGNQLIVSMDREVVAKDGEAPKGFILAGPDGNYQVAKAEIRGKEIVLTAAGIEMPTAARYAWADNPICNLYDAESLLPVAPFRTRE